MIRRFRSRKSWLLIAIALVVACWCSPAAAYQLEVTAWIDGYSQLVIQGSTVQWHNISWTVPGWETPLADAPTTLTTADMGVVDWYPGWTNYFGDQWSDQFTGLNLAMAAVDQTVGFSFTGRENAFISQQPSAGNSYTLIVDFDDNAPGGAAWYTVCLDYQPVPVPPSVLLLGVGLLSLAGLQRVKKN